MEQILPFFIWMPFLTFIGSFLFRRKQERALSVFTIVATGLHLIALLIFSGYWFFQGAGTLDIKQWVLYQSPGFEFFIDFYFDITTAVFALTGGVAMFLVSVFSRYYLHREEGFKRFFTTLALFYAGYNLVILAGNFETLFIGWEFLGISSFLLIAFYRDRYLPVRNGLKVLSFYRLSDIALILAMWMSHHIWHKNITFAEWHTGDLIQAAFQQHAPQTVFVILMVVLAAVIKSAQLPFSSWLPRAMEGPTSSSAIFYGALSVHIGVFLLLRTYLLWESQGLVKGLILAVGLATSLLGSVTARVQSSVKAQIAYASVVQIGLMFIEVALGFHTLALIHFAGNAFLRTYQLLVSPSVLGYLIHDMFFHFKASATPAQSPALWRRLQHAVYMMGTKEWNLDSSLYRYLWSPFKYLGNELHFLNRRWFYVIGGLFLSIGLVMVVVEPAWFDGSVWAPVYAALGLWWVLKAFAARGDARHAWAVAGISQGFIALAVSLNGTFGLTQTFFYLGGGFVAALTGYYCLHTLVQAGESVEMDQYQGHSYEWPGYAFVFLLACLGTLGFPITPSFIGIDLMFTYIHAHQYVLIACTGLYFLFLELAMLRVYARVFLGQHRKAYHPIAFKSS